MISVTYNQKCPVNIWVYIILCPSEVQTDQYFHSHKYNFYHFSLDSFYNGIDTVNNRVIINRKGVKGRLDHIGMPFVQLFQEAAI